MVLADDETPAGKVRALDLGKVAVVEKRQLQGSAFGGELLDCRSSARAVASFAAGSINRSTISARVLDPLPRRHTVCSRLFLPRCRRPSPKEKWVGFPQLSRLKRLRAGGLSRLQIFRYVPASKFARPPDRPYRCEYSRRAAGAFTSEQNAVRYLPAHRIC